MLHLGTNDADRTLTSRLPEAVCFMARRGGSTKTPVRPIPPCTKAPATPDAVLPNVNHLISPVARTLWSFIITSQSIASFHSHLRNFQKLLVFRAWVIEQKVFVCDHKIDISDELASRRYFMTYFSNKWKDTTFYFL